MAPVFSSYRMCVAQLQDGGVGIIPTDTLYGVVGLARNEKAVERIYELKGRNEHKPLIVLISSVNDLSLFSIELSDEMRKIVAQYWPGPNSIILPCKLASLSYLHRGTNTIAFRLPNNPDLQALIEATGPLVAPSANPQGLAPAKTISEARSYFGEQVDLYMDGGTLNNPPSSVFLFDEETASCTRVR